MSQCSFCGRGEGVVARLIENGPGTVLICNECADVIYAVCHEKDGPKVGATVHLPSQKPCEIPCPVCGSTDINRQFHPAGQCFRDGFNKRTDTTEFVKRTEHPFSSHTVLKNCLTNHCRCCQFGWDTAALGTPT